MAQNQQKVEDDYLERFRKYKEQKASLKPTVSNEKSRFVHKPATKIVLGKPAITSFKNTAKTVHTAKPLSSNRATQLRSKNVENTKATVPKSKPLTHRKPFTSTNTNSASNRLTSTNANNASNRRPTLAVSKPSRPNPTKSAGMATSTAKKGPIKTASSKPACVDATENDDGEKKKAWMERYEEWRKKKSGDSNGDNSKRRHTMASNYIPTGRASVNFKVDRSAKKSSTNKRESTHSKQVLNNTASNNDPEIESRLCGDASEDADKKNIDGVGSDIGAQNKRKSVYKVVKSRIDTGLSNRRLTTMKPTFTKSSVLNRNDPKRTIKNQTSVKHDLTKRRQTLANPANNNGTNNTKSSRLVRRHTIVSHLPHNKPVITGQKRRISSAPTVETKRPRLSNVSQQQPRFGQKQRQSLDSKKTASKTQVPKKPIGGQKRRLSPEPNVQKKRPRRSILKTPRSTSEGDDQNVYPMTPRSSVRFMSPANNSSGSPVLGRKVTTSTPAIPHRTPVKTTPITKQMLMREKLDSWLEEKGKTPSGFQGLRNFNPKTKIQGAIECGLSEQELEVQQTVLSEESDSRSHSSSSDITDAYTDKLNILLKECSVLLDSGCPGDMIEGWQQTLEDGYDNIRESALYWVISARIAEQRGESMENVIKVYEDAIQYSPKPPELVADALKNYIMRVMQNVKPSEEVEEKKNKKKTRRPSGVDTSNMFESSATKYIVTDVPASQRTPGKNTPHTPKAVVTPVRRSTRKSCSSLPRMFQDHDDVFENVQEIPDSNQVLFRPNVKLETEFVKALEESSDEENIE